ncbi:MAG: glutamate--tRNA ligase family protein, partial [bacterium]|nr:glutamate--tRNA ligase family protein [bacterium]
MTEIIEKRTHFIRQLITDELNSGKHQSVVTRFPPEPNGYLHVGHAKSICLNFGLAEEFNGTCFLRFDDTNPMKEEDEYVKAIIDDVKWLGFSWSEMTHSSDYYQALYDFAVVLIKKDMAYIDSLSMEEIRAYRGTLQTPGKESPYRNRPMEESLDLFHRMKSGEFADGTHVLRAKIDMLSGNINMRDPVLYRIRHAHHQRT